MADQGVKSTDWTPGSVSSTSWEISDADGDTYIFENSDTYLFEDGNTFVYQ